MFWNAEADEYKSRILNIRKQQYIHALLVGSVLPQPAQLHSLLKRCQIVAGAQYKLNISLPDRIMRLRGRLERTFSPQTPTMLFDSVQSHTIVTNTRTRAHHRCVWGWVKQGCKHIYIHEYIALAYMGESNTAYGYLFNGIHVHHHAYHTSAWFAGKLPEYIFIRTEIHLYILSQYNIECMSLLPVDTSTLPPSSRAPKHTYNSFPYKWHIRYVRPECNHCAQS